MAASPPTSVESFFERLRQVSGGLPKRMRQCADFLSANTDRIAVSTVAELAEAADVQPSAMMRFCQLLGFSGFSEMQKLFRTSYSPRPLDYKVRLANLRDQGANTPSALLAEFVEAGHLSLENMTEMVDAQSLDEAVNQLSGAQTIHVVGFKRAFPVAAYLVYALEKMQVPAILHDGMGKLNNASALRPDDAMIAITFSPYTQETLDLAQEAVNKKLSVIGVTDTPVSPLHMPGVLPLYVSEVDFGAFRSLSATLTLAISLSVAVGTRINAQR
ncbi:MAG: MurR/RpiR family transcriptional regulator [Pseudomonadota bacterium]